MDDDTDGFKQAKADWTIDLESRLNDYIALSRSNAIHDLATDEGIEEESLVKFVDEYNYLHREKPEIIQRAVKSKKGLKLLERTRLQHRILDRLRKIINTYNWD